MDSLTKRPIMGIGMVMPHVVEIFPYGHMWVYWKEVHHLNNLVLLRSLLGVR